MAISLFFLVFSILQRKPKPTQNKTTAIPQPRSRRRSAFFMSWGTESGRLCDSVLTWPARSSRRSSQSSKRASSSARCSFREWATKNLQHPSVGRGELGAGGTGGLGLGKGRACVMFLEGTCWLSSKVLFCLAPVCPVLFTSTWLLFLGFLECNLLVLDKGTGRGSLRKPNDF